MSRTMDIKLLVVVVASLCVGLTMAKLDEETADLFRDQGIEMVCKDLKDASVGLVEKMYVCLTKLGMEIIPNSWGKMYECGEKMYGPVKNKKELFLIACGKREEIKNCIKTEYALEKKRLTAISDEEQQKLIEKLTACQSIKE